MNTTKFKSSYNIQNTAHQLTLAGMLKFEAISLYGRTFLNRKPNLDSLERACLNLGCGPRKFEGWVNADFFAVKKSKKGKPKPDWMLDLRYPLNCEDNVWDGVFTEHTLEHLYPDRVIYLLHELYRTMKPGAWIRITVPDLQKYVNYYCGLESHEKFVEMFATGSEAIRTMTQDFIHLSVWDSKLLSEFLTTAGFANIKEVSFMQGTDRLLIKDMEERSWETLYIEAQKPLSDLIDG